MHIGVLAYRGDDYALQRWSATAEYLSQTLPNYNIDLQPLTMLAMNQAVAANQLDFVLTSPGHYVELESRYGATRIATRKNYQNGLPLTHYGAVIFTRTERNDIQTLEDLHGKRFATVGVRAFGGFQMAWREMGRHGLNSLQNIQIVDMGFPQDGVVRAVLNNSADAGTVRTGVLESMASTGQINIQDVKILNPILGDFPFLLSTPLYPEWAFAKLAATPDTLAEQVAIALLSIRPDEAAISAENSQTWTIPLDYTAVHALLRELRVTPYEDFGKITLPDLLKQYWAWLLTIGVGFLIGNLLLLYAYHLNRRLQQASLYLEEEIQEHQLIKQRLLSLNARLQHLLTATPAIIYSCAPERTFPTTFISDNVQTQLGYEPHEFLNDKQFWFDHIHPDDKLAVQKSMDVLMRSGSAQREYRFRTKDGSYRWLHDDVRLVLDENKTPVEVVGYWVDMTDKITAQEMARTHENELAHCLRLTTMGEMATALAHDINQPLSAVHNYIQGCVLRLRAGQLDSRQLLHTLEEVIGQTERAAAVIRHVRAFVSKEAPLRVNRNVNDLIQDAVRLIMPEARGADIPIRLHLIEDPVQVVVNPTQIQQVIINLARNALESMATMTRGNRVLFIETSVDENIAKILIRDTGPGVAPALLSQIFDAFYTTKSGGMGMGLSISRTIIESHDGRLWAEPGEPHGMAFMFTLPLARDNS